MTRRLPREEEARSEDARIETGNSTRLLTVDDFRRAFFPESARPTRKRVREWIRDGFRGVYLSGFELDGEYFVDAEKVEVFFAALALLTKKASAPRTIVARRSNASRASDALGSLRANFGFK